MDDVQRTAYSSAEIPRRNIDVFFGRANRRGYYGIYSRDNQSGVSLVTKAFYGAETTEEPCGERALGGFRDRRRGDGCVWLVALNTLIWI